MANTITLIRLVIVFFISFIALYCGAKTNLMIPPLIFLNILLDGVDGYIARALNEESVFGATFDIAADRVVEMVLWIILAKINIISIWIPIIFITRGILVDSLRKPAADAGKMPFDMMQTQIGRFLVASRTMRFASGAIKLICFCWLFTLHSVVKFWPNLILSNLQMITLASDLLVKAALIISLARGIPVIAESMMINLNGRGKA